MTKQCTAYTNGGFCQRAAHYRVGRRYAGTRILTLPVCRRHVLRAFLGINGANLGIVVSVQTIRDDE